MLNYLDEFNLDDSLRTILKKDILKRKIKTKIILNREIEKYKKSNIKPSVKTRKRSRQNKRKSPSKKSDDVRKNPRYFGDESTSNYKYPGPYSNKSSPASSYYKPRRKTYSSTSVNPGVYKIVNNRTGEVFVSYSKNIDRSFKKHMTDLRKRRHRNEDMQSDFNRGDRFSAVVLETFSYADTKELSQAAKRWIERENSYNRGYNCYSGGGYNPYASNKHHSAGRRLDGRASKDSRRKR